MRARVMWGLAMAMAVLAAAAPARSAPITISVGGTSITVDGESQDGLFNWVAGGADQLSQQWIWFRQGNTAESSLNTLNLVGTDVGPNFISLAYQTADQGLAIAVRYDLIGGSQPTINETILVQNLSTAGTEVALFLYSDIDVNADPDGDTATGGVNGIAQTQGGTTITVLPLSLGPDAFQIDFFPDLLDLLNDGVATDLNNSGSGLGPADLTHAFQWNLALGPGETVELLVVKQFTQVPGPASLGLLLGGLLVAGALRWRGRRQSA